MCPVDLSLQPIEHERLQIALAKKNWFENNVPVIPNMREKILLPQVLLLHPQKYRTSCVPQVRPQKIMSLLETVSFRGRVG